jgi:hypothetical protein
MHQDKYERLRHPTAGYEISFNPRTTTKFHLPGGAEMEGIPANEFYRYSQVIATMSYYDSFEEGK